MFIEGLISPKWINPWLEEVYSWHVRKGAVMGRWGTVVLE